jgi:hypothetical protein
MARRRGAEKQAATTTATASAITVRMLLSRDHSAAVATIRIGGGEAECVQHPMARRREAEKSRREMIGTPTSACCEALWRPQFSAQCSEAVLDTLFRPEDDAQPCQFGRRNGNRGLAAEPWPRTI